MGSSGGGKLLSLCGLLYSIGFFGPLSELAASGNVVGTLVGGIGLYCGIEITYAGFIEGTSSEGNPALSVQAYGLCKKAAAGAYRMLKSHISTPSV
jgi:hypothetical protein